MQNFKFFKIISFFLTPKFLKIKVTNESGKSRLDGWPNQIKEPLVDEIWCSARQKSYILILQNSYGVNKNFISLRKNAQSCTLPQISRELPIPYYSFYFHIINSYSIINSFLFLAHYFMYYSINLSSRWSYFVRQGIFSKNRRYISSTSDTKE